VDLKAQEMMVNIPKVRHVDRVARIELLKVYLCILKVSLIVKRWSCWVWKMDDKDR